MDFKDRLTICITRRGISQHELSRHTGIATATISRYLSGKRSPTAENIIRLAGFFGVTTDYILGVSDEVR